MGISLCFASAGLWFCYNLPSQMPLSQLTTNPHPMRQYSPANAQFALSNNHLALSNIGVAKRMLALAVVLFSLSNLGSNGLCFGQLTVLSSGNVNLKWRSTQLELIEQQLQDTQIKGPLRLELEAQKQWLGTWSAGSLTESPLLEQESVGQLMEEPIIDPNGLATNLREQLLGKEARPTVDNTDALLTALRANPDDPGLRQLHLHWLDQKQYRERYAAEIADLARRLAGIYAAVNPQTEELKIARGFCHYRCARALAYRELPEVVLQKPIADLQSHEAELLAAYSQLVELFGNERPEFILLEIRMLRRDHWYGHALSLLEKHGKIIDRQWFLEKRRDLLQELGWTGPAKEAAEIYANAFPE